MKNSKWTLLVLAMVAVAAVGCGSDNGNNPVEPPIDTAPPILPTGLELSYDAVAQTVTLIWNENTADADFAGFLVSRTAFGETVALVDAPEVNTTYVDNIRTVGRFATYRIYSVDTTGNVSAAAMVAFDANVPIGEATLPNQ